MIYETSAQTSKHKNITNNVDNYPLVMAIRKFYQQFKKIIHNCKIKIHVQT